MLIAECDLQSQRPLLALAGSLAVRQARWLGALPWLKLSCLEDAPAA